MDTRASMSLTSRSLPAVLAAALTIAGCAVGPEYHRPQVTPPQQFRSQVGASEAGSLADVPAVHQLLTEGRGDGKYVVRLHG